MAKLNFQHQYSRLQCHLSFRNLSDADMLLNISVGAVMPILIC